MQMTDEGAMSLDDGEAPGQAASMPPEERDLGFGSVVASESRKRLLNPDGSFNVARRGLGFWTSLSIYHALLRTTWPRFLATLAGGYLAANTVFALLYLACGRGALMGDDTGLGNAFLRAFFFSVETLATIGYGNIVPVGILPNLVVVAEALVGVLGFALATGLLFARFSRPSARIVFSRQALIAPYRGGRAFMLRIANARRSEIIELEAKLVLTMFEDEEGGRTRRFHALPLERQRVAFFPLAWTIVHPIDAASPLAGLDAAQLLAREPEFLVLLTGIEETFSQTVHARSSYRAAEVVWGARFADMFNRQAVDADLTIDMAR
ncbi:MAG TPA: ion channel, partial [Longimicrobiales bacterium]